MGAGCGGGGVMGFLGWCGGVLGSVVGGEACES